MSIWICKMVDACTAGIESSSRNAELCEEKEFMMILKTRCDPSPCRDHQYVDGVGTLNRATNPSYPDTEPRMSRIKTRTGPSVSGSTVAKTHFSNQKQTDEPSLPKTR